MSSDISDEAFVLIKGSKTLGWSAEVYNHCVFFCDSFSLGIVCACHILPDV